MHAVATKIVPLNEGSNTFYIHVTNPDQTVSTYTVNIYRNHLYTVRFNANGGTSVSTQYVEEGYLAEEPTTSRVGYTFVDWDYNFNSPITSNITINANWNANGDTPYKVEYYLQNLDKTGYIPVTSEEENLTGATDTTAYAEQKTFEHFTLNSSKSMLSGNIHGDGSLVLRVYYTRNTYNVSTSRNNTKAGTVTSGGTYAYDKQIALTAATNPGYTFLGWFEGEEKVCDTLSYTFKVDHTATYTAKWETNVYNITYELNDGVNNESNVATYTVETPTITLSSPERTGYEFGGWFIDEEFTTQATKIMLGSYGEKTFYARWTPIVYKITYDHNYQGVTTESAYVITNDSTYPWNVSNGVLISSNKANSSSATYKIVANSEITISFKYKVSSESGYDFLTIVKNGTQVDKISGSTSYVAYSTTLYAGEYITFTYSKDSSQYSGSDCAYIADLACTQNRYTTEVEYNIETPTFILMTPERAGYTFNGWFTEGAFENQVSNISLGSHGNKTFYAKWTANTDTPYRVEYYLENLDKNGYADPIVVELDGITDTTANAEQKIFEHFALDTSKSTLSGNINGDGSLVLRVYYTRNIYTVSNSNSSYGSVVGAGSYVYGSITNVELTATAMAGHDFDGWYCNGELVSSSLKHTFNADCNLEARFAVKDEMANFKFTYTATTCSITGIKDKKVTEIIVPDYVTSISDGAFSGCSSLESITLPFVGGSRKTSSDTYQYPLGYIFGTSSYTGGVKTEQYYYGSSTTSGTFSTYYIPSSLKSVTVTGGDILEGAFYHCSKLTSVTIPDSVTSIGSYAFRYCDSLTSITIPDSVTSIGSCAFENCDSLTSVIISENSSLEYIGSCAFSGCDSLKSITIPDGVTSIGYCAFSSCSSLTSVVIPDSVTEIGDYAFKYCSSLTSVVIPDSVTEIGEDAFSSCSSLTSVTIGDSVTTIGSGAFAYCSSLTSVVIGDSVTRIGSYAFRNCSGLTSVTIPEGVTSIGNYAFYSCYKLVEVINKSSLNITAGSSSYGYVGYYAKEVHKGEGKIVNKDGYLFYTYNGVNYLIGYVGDETDLVLPESYNGESYEIYKDAFYYCDSLTSITIPDSVTSIGSYAFRYCDSLTSITIPDSVTSIGDWAFGYCDSLTSVTIPDSVTTIGYDAFSSCSSLTIYCEAQSKPSGWSSEWNSSNRPVVWGYT